MVDPAHEQVEPVHSHVSAAPVAPPRTWSWTGFALRIFLTLVGAAGMVISSFMDWAQGRAATDISIRSLWSTRFDHTGNNWLTTVGAVLVVLAVIAMVGLSPRSGWLTSLAGALGVAVLVLLVVQIYRANLSLSDLGPGAWIGLAGSIVAVIAGFFGTRTTVVVAGPTVVNS